MRLILMTLALVLSATVGFAHSKLKNSEPAAGATVAAAPTEIELSYATQIRLTRVTVKRNEDEAVQLDLSDYQSFATDFTLVSGVQGRGMYLVNWRGLGADGHPLTGEFQFEVE